MISEYRRIETFTFQLEVNNDIDEINIFQSAIEKMVKQVGFANKLTKKEKELLLSLNKKINNLNENANQ